MRVWWGILAVLAATGAMAGPLPCRVTRVVDGDTVQMECQGVPHRVRLLGFDTPEVYHPGCAAERAAGRQAARLLQQVVAAGPVTALRFEGRDRYGRDLGALAISGRDVAEAMIASGLARAYGGGRRPDWCGR